MSDSYGIVNIMTDYATLYCMLFMLYVFAICFYFDFEINTKLLQLDHEPFTLNVYVFYIHVELFHLRSSSLHLKCVAGCE